MGACMIIVGALRDQALAPVLDQGLEEACQACIPPAPHSVRVLGIVWKV